MSETNINTKYGDLKVYGDWQRKYFKLQPNAEELLKDFDTVIVEYSDERYEANIKGKKHNYIYKFFKKHYKNFQIGEVLSFVFDSDERIISIINSTSIPNALSKLIDDIKEIEEYKELKEIHNRTNLFKILGQSNTERWHTAFWSWLFDIHGSHDIGDFALRKLFETLSDFQNDNRPFAKPFFQIPDVTKQEIWPNEYGHSEKLLSMTNKSNVKFDTFIETEGAITVIEYKVEAKVDSEQLNRYESYMNRQESNYTYMICVLPESTICESESFESLQSKFKNWYILSYQNLYEKIIIPILSDNKVTGKAKMIIEDYSLNMSSNRKKVTMIYSIKEQNLVKSLYENHNELIEDAMIQLKNSNKVSVEINNDDYQTIAWIQGALSFLRKRNIIV